MILYKVLLLPNKKANGALLIQRAKLSSHFNMIKLIHLAKDWLRLSLLIQINMVISIQKARWLSHPNMKLIHR